MPGGMYPDIFGSLEDAEQTRANLQYMLMRTASGYQRLQAYYEGSHNHHFSSVGYNAQFGMQMRGYRDNFLPMILAEYAARLNIKGFRVGSESTDYTTPDADATRFWNSNFMGAESNKAIIDSQKFGISYLLVDPFLKSPDDLAPRITVESPIHMYALPDPTNRYQFVVAIKQWQGTDGFLYQNVFYPDHVNKYKSTQHAQIEYTRPGMGSWAFLGDVANPLGKVPITAIENCSQVHMWGGRSDMEVLIPLQDQINTLQKNMMVSSEYQAFRQRLILGVDVARDPVTDKVIDPDVVFAASRVVMIPNENAKVAEWAQMDPSVYTSVIEQTVHHLSALAKMPAYLLANKIANLSADAMRAAEQGFVDALKQKQKEYSPGFEGAMRLAFLAETNKSAKEPIFTIWESAEATSGSVLSNELVQMQALGVPKQLLWARWGMSPEEIAYAEQLMQEEQQQEQQDQLAQQQAMLKMAGQSSVKTNNFGTPPKAKPSGPGRLGGSGRGQERTGKAIPPSK